MNVRRIIQERLRARLGDRGSVEVEGDLDAAVAANVGERGRVTTASSTTGSPTRGRGRKRSRRSA